MLLLVSCALFLGLALAESAQILEENATSDMNMTNETENATINETINATEINQTLINATLSNQTLINATMPENETGLDDDANPFENAKGRQPNRR